MQNYDEIYKKTKEYESDIQKMIGQKSSLQDQLKDKKKEKQNLEKMCQEKFGVPLKELDEYKDKVEAEITKGYNELEKKMNETK
jgi:hypothetical protein